METNIPPYVRVSDLCDIFQELADEVQAELDALGDWATPEQNAYMKGRLFSLHAAIRAFQRLFPQEVRNAQETTLCKNRGGQEVIKAQGFRETFANMKDCENFLIAHFEQNQIE
jgi:hypothetical protein